MFTKRIIVGGLPRSGSTLLRFLLDSTDKVISGPETSFFTEPLHKQQMKVERVAERLAKKLDLDVNAIRKVILEAGSSDDAFDRLMLDFSRHVGVSKGIWAEKSPDNCIHYGRLQIENPDYYFISTVRHGLDVTTSVIEGHPTRGDDYWVPVQLYVDCMPYIYNFKSSRHLIVRYEDLVSEPVETMEKISGFLDIPFKKDIVEKFRVEAKSRDLTKVHQPKLKSEIQETWVNRYKEPRHRERVAEFLANESARSWLHRSGYTVDL